MEPNLFWAIAEKDIDDNDTYLPPGTPLNALHSKRHYDLLKRQHCKQRQRLLIYQLQELRNFEEEFNKQHQDEDFIQPDVTMCEELNGSFFLVKNEQVIGQLLSKNNQRHKPNRPKDSENDIILNRHKSEYLLTLKKKYAVGVDEIWHSQQMQLKQLLESQSKELSNFPLSVTDPEKARHEADQKARRDADQKARRNADQKPNKEQDSPGSRKSKKHKKRKLEEQKTLETPSNKPAFKGVTSSAENKGMPPAKNKGQPIVTSITKKIVPNTIPMVTSSLTVKNKVGPPSVLPTKEAVVPLFNKNSKNQSKPVSLTDKGVLRVLKGPNRVVICDQNGKQTVYGDPKDYDDALNGPKRRPDNTVHKRMVCGTQYLFYKTGTGGMVNIGPVSKIQPIIHQFFLST